MVSEDKSKRKRLLEVVARPGAWTAMCLAALCLAVLLTRIFPAIDYVYVDGGEIRLLGNDPYYHLRQSKHVSANFPDIQRWDVGTNYPTGQFARPLGFFNYTIAALSRVVALGAHSEAAVEFVSAWISPVLAVFSVLLLYRLARVFLGRGVSLVVCLLFAAYPGSALDRTLLGFGDHHSAEMLLNLLTILGYLAVLKREAAVATPWWRMALFRSLPLGIFLYTWSGAAMYLLILGTCAWAQATFELARGRDGFEFCRANARYFAGFLFWIFLIRILIADSWTSPVSMLRVAGTAVAVAAAPFAYAGVARMLVSRRGLSAFAAAGTSFGIVVIAAVATYCLSETVRGSAAFLLGQKSIIVNEHIPVSPKVYWDYAGIPGILAVLAMPVAILGIWRGRIDRNKAGIVEGSGSRYRPLILTFACLWVILWVRTSDYNYVSTLHTALLSGFAIEPAARWWRRRFQESKGSALPAARVMWAGMAVCVLAAPAWPMGWTELPWKGREAMERVVKPETGDVEALRWLRENTPEPPVTPRTRFPERLALKPFDYPEGSYGVMSSWDVGNYVAEIGNRVPVWSRYPSKKTTQFMLETDPAKGWDFLCPTRDRGDRVRYVVLQPVVLAQHYIGKVTTMKLEVGEYVEHLPPVRFEGMNIPIGIYGRKHLDSMAARLFFRDATGLGHYRLVYESRHESFFRYLYMPKEEMFIAEARAIDSPEERLLFEKRMASGPVWREGDHFGYYGVFLPTTKVFEAVEGARLRGMAPGANSVVAMLAMGVGSTGREFVYRNEAEVAPDGSFEVRVPYNTTNEARGTVVGTNSIAGYDVIAVAPAGVRVRPVSAAVTEQQVQAGEAVEIGEITEPR